MRKLLLTLGFALVAVLVMAQTRSISGVIKDATGQPVPGAAVMMPGTTTGTISDFDGRYTLNVPENATTLTVSFMGYQDAVVDLNSGNFDVVLQDDSKQVNEVIVVAYGTTTKQAFTGSAAVVGSEELSKHTATNVTSALAGQVPGLQLRGNSGDPGANNGELKIRGIVSLYAETNPLVVVDGAPYDGSLSNIPADEIENLTVLKDAASAALYGARGAAGVILITTKKGKEAQGRINVDAKWGVNSRAVQDYDVITNPAEYYEAYYTSRFNQYYYGNGMSAAVANENANKQMLSDLGYNCYTVPEGEFLVGMDGKLNPKATLGRTYTDQSGKVYYVTPDDWIDEAYNRGLRQEYTISASRGDAEGNFFTSVGYLKDNGIIDHTSFRRFSARVKADKQIKEWVKVGANANYVNTKRIQNSGMEYKGNGEDEQPGLGENNIMYFVSRIAPIYPVYIRSIDENGVPYVITDEYGNVAYDFAKGKQTYGVPADKSDGTSMIRGFLQGNPLGNNIYNAVSTESNLLNGNMTATVNFLPCLKLDVNSSVSYEHSVKSDYGNSLYGSKVSVGGSIEKIQEKFLRQNHVQTLNWYDTFSDVHNWNAMIGHEWYDKVTTYIQVLSEGGYSPEIQEINAFAKIADHHGYTKEYNVEGYFGTLQYNYDLKYYLQGSYRRDASCRFDKNKSWGNFWSAGGAWIVSKEDFMQPTLGVLDELKVKFSIGQQGNDNIKDYAFTNTYVLTKSSETTVSPEFSRVGNPDITWETTTNTNVGLEFSFLLSRISGSFDYYSKKTTDLLFWLSIPESAGSRGYYSNVGAIRNRGFELTITGSPIRTEDLNWSLNFNIAHNATKILSFPESKTRQYGGYYAYNLWFEEGGEHYNFMTYEYAGVDEQGQALYWYDEDLSSVTHENDANIVAKAAKKHSGKTADISKASRYAQGSILPKFYGGFGTTFTWKGIDASASFDYQIGGKIMDRLYADMMSPAKTVSDAGRNFHKDWKRSWSPNNTSSDIPRWQWGDQYAANTSTRFLTNASYLNFSQFVVGYTLPKDLTERFYIDKLRFYVAGENLTFWSARKGLDPRYSYKENEAVGNYSPARTISGGIQLSF